MYLNRIVLPRAVSAREVPDVESSSLVLGLIRLLATPSVGSKFTPDALRNLGTRPENHMPIWIGRGLEGGVSVDTSWQGLPVDKKVLTHEELSCDVAELMVALRYADLRGDLPWMEVAMVCDAISELVEEQRNQRAATPKVPCTEPACASTVSHSSGMRPPVAFESGCGAVTPAQREPVQSERIVVATPDGLFEAHIVRISGRPNLAVRGNARFLGFAYSSADLVGDVNRFDDAEIAEFLKRQ